MAFYSFTVDKKSWVCFDNTFLQIDSHQCLKMLEEGISIPFASLIPKHEDATNKGLRVSKYHKPLLFENGPILMNPNV